MTQVSLTTPNEETYEELISLIENSQKRLAPIIVACDDRTLRERIIQRYEAEARQATIHPYRIELGEEPSVRAGLARLKDADPYLQQGGAAVFTVTGAELLLRVHLRSEDTGQTQLDKFFGYLQWTREGLREFPYPIVLWISHRILREMSRRAPDFWSWRKAVLRFTEENPAITVSVTSPEPLPRQIEPEPDDEFLPPLEDLQEQVAHLEAKSPESSSLATLYDLLGQVYARRVNQGKATDLQHERQLAINAFQTAISRHQTLGNKSAQMNSLGRLGNFLSSQSRFVEVIGYYQQALKLALEIGNQRDESRSLNNLGSAYQSLGQYQRAIDFLQQSLEIDREIGDRYGEACSLGNLGILHRSLGQYEQAINFDQQSLEIYRNIGDRYGEAKSLMGLGNTYDALEQYEWAINFFQQSLQVHRDIGCLKGEAASLGNLANIYQALRQHERAINFDQQSLEIYRNIGDRCGEAKSLTGLGSSYSYLGQYQQALNFLQRSLQIHREIKDSYGEAVSFLGAGYALAKLDRRFEAKQAYQQALGLFTQLGLDHKVEECKTAIYRLQQTVSPAPVRAPSIRDEPPQQPDWLKKSLPTPSPSQRPRRRRTFFSRLRQFLHRLLQKLFEWIRR